MKKFIDSLIDFFTEFIVPTRFGPWGIHEVIRFALGMFIILGLVFSTGRLIVDIFAGKWPFH